MTDRTIKQAIVALPTSDGAGVQLKRSIGTDMLSELDPFLLFDHFGTENPDDYIAGFLDHPHRGFETVTYMIHGLMRHKDSSGRTPCFPSVDALRAKIRAASFSAARWPVK